MTSTISYALMAGASYISNRAPINQFPGPQGWSEITELRRNNPLSGFEATSFINSETLATSTEVVISYAGTDFSEPGSDFLHGNIPLAAGIVSDQLKQAAEYYLQVKALAPANAHIALTGHSLGGGLAALIGVFFGETAKTFDQAPFYLTAVQGATVLKNYLIGKLDGTGKRLYDDHALSGLTNFIQQQQANGGVPNSGLVTNINVQGEIVSAGSLLRVGTETSIPQSTPVSAAELIPFATNLHSQALLTAFLQSQQTAVSGKALNDLTAKLPDLLKLIFDEKLYSRNPKGAEENFLERLVKHEAGAGTALPADAMVTRFTRDLWKLAQDGGLTISDGYDFKNNLSKALTAFAMQKYYDETLTSAGYKKVLFNPDSTITGGIQFDIADVAKAFNDAFTAGQPLDLSEAKGYTHFQSYLNLAFTPEERSLIASLLPTLRDWYVQAGASGMTATDTQNRAAFLLGGVGSDELVGGDAADLLVGNRGSDKLTGGKGNDALLGGQGADNLNGGDGADLLLGGADNDILDGGAGNDLLKGGDGSDTYVFTGSYGTDIITDSDGSGAITADGQTLSSATQKFESIYKSESTGYTFVKLNGGNNLVLLKEGEANRILVNDWSEARSLGISLQGNTPTAPAATLTGDFKKKINDQGTPSSSDDSYVIENGNYVADGAEADALDLISGMTGNDVIDGKGGDDALSGKAGDDYIEGGTGSDAIQGGLGKDTINGGAGDDYIYGSSDLDITLPTSINFTKPQNQYPHPQGTGFNWTSGYYTLVGGVPDGYSDVPRNRLADDNSNVIDGGAGNDFIAAGTGADYVHGGIEDDLIIGMDKDDVLFGDGGNDLIYGDGGKPVGLSVVWTLPENHGNDIIDGGDGKDILLGQGGLTSSSAERVMICFGGTMKRLLLSTHPITAMTIWMVETTMTNSSGAVKMTR